MNGIEMEEIPQSQFIPLPEALCLAISSLNQIGKPAFLDDIRSMLKKQYSGMNIPKNDVIHQTLNTLLTEGKVMGSNNVYFMSSPYSGMTPGMMFSNPGTRGMVQTPTDPYNTLPFMWQGTERPQESCSRECQTGPSVVNAIPPYKGTVKCEKAANICSERRSSVPLSVAVKQKPRSRPLSTEKPPKEAKVGFFTRLFRKRSKSKTRENATNQQKGESCCPMGDQATEARGPAVPYATFAAQFPPPEWLHDPRYAKFAAQEAQMAAKEQQQHLIPLFRQKRQSKEVKQAPRGQMWLELDMHKFSSRERTDSHFRSIRNFPLTCPSDNPNHLPPMGSPKRNRHKQRLSKYLSSSSECVYPLSSKMNADWNTTKRERDRMRTNQRDGYRLGLDLVDLEKLPVSEPFCDRVLESGTDRTGRQDFRKPRPIATSTDLDESRLGNISEVVASPTPSKDEPTTPNVARNNLAVLSKETAIAADSAVSVSPNTDKSSENKYSSWSGSEGTQGQQPLDKDHTYMNLKDSPGSGLTPGVNHTYENLKVSNYKPHAALLDSTQFEHVTDATFEASPTARQNEETPREDQHPAKLKLKVSQQYVSAL